MTSDIPAVVSRSTGPITDANSLVDAYVPHPGAPRGHDLLVEVKAISINPVDVKIRISPNPTGTERILGWDAAGVVLAVGEEVTQFQPGDEVYYAGALDRPGTNMSQQLVDERIVAHKPQSVTFAEAAALPLTAITAWEGLFDKFGLAADSTGTLLVVGAAGGVGSILIQLAKQLTKLKVIATASRPETTKWVSELGADAVVDHQAENLAQLVLAEAPGGVDYIFSAKSKGRMPFFADIIRPFGQIVGIDDADDLDLMLLKSKAASWHWEFMFTRPRYGHDMEYQRDLLIKVAELVDAERLRSTMTTMLGPINAEQLREAHRLIETGNTIGKIVISNTSE